MTLRFDELVRAGMLVRDVKQRWPETRPVFDGYGFRDSCDDCSIETVARKYALDSTEIVEALNRRIREAG